MASSLAYSAAFLREVDEILGRGATVADNRDGWLTLSAEQRKAHMIVRHEASHHRLLTGTPAGILLWRINQIIGRDVFYIRQALREEHVECLGELRAFLSSSTFLAKHARAGEKLEYVRRDVVPAVENLLQLREIMYGKLPGRRFGDLTFSDLCSLMNRSYAYMAARCGVDWSGVWRTRVGHEKVFPQPRSPNARDLVEVEGASAEMWYARAFGDWQYAKGLHETAGRGPYAQMFAVVASLAPTSDPLGVSPFLMQLYCNVACSGNIDVVPAPTGDLYLEDHLPWTRCRLLDPAIGNAATVTDGIRVLDECRKSPLVGAAAQWLVYPHSQVRRQQPGHNLSLLSSAGMELQLWTIKESLANSLNFVSAAMMSPSLVREDALNHWLVNAEMRLILKECEDEIELRLPNTGDVYSSTHPLRLIDIDGIPFTAQLLLGNIAVGVAIGAAIATYEGHAFWNLEAIGRKVGEACRRQWAWTSEQAELVSQWIAGLLDMGGSPFGSDSLVQDQRKIGF